jgi:hypothetical protein
VKLEHLIEHLDAEGRTDTEFDAYLARLLRVGKLDTLSAPTTRYSLDAFGVLERDAAGRLRKRADFVVADKVDFAAIEDARLREAQAREEEEHRQRELNFEAERNPLWEAQQQTIRGVVDDRLRQLGLIDADGRVVRVTRPGEGPAER